MLSQPEIHGFAVATIICVLSVAVVMAALYLASKFTHKLANTDHDPKHRQWASDDEYKKAIYRCPRCGSYNVVAVDDVDFDSSCYYGIQPVLCHDCHSTWDDYYEIVFYIPTTDGFDKLKEGEADEFERDSNRVQGQDGGDGQG